MRFATKTIHAAQPSEPETGALVAPIFQTSTYEQDEPGVNRGFDYSRTNNPTRARLEAVLAELEGVQYCATFGSGLAAENAILQAYLKPGDEIVIKRPLGRKQTVMVRGLADRHIAKAEARALYEDRTPKPTDAELELRRMAKLARAFSRTPDVTPDKRERRRIRKMKEEG